MDKRKENANANELYFLGFEAYKADGIAKCVRDAILKGDWQPEEYIGGIEALCDKTQELLHGIEAVYEKLFNDRIGG